LEYSRDLVEWTTAGGALLQSNTRLAGAPVKDRLTFAIPAEETGRQATFLRIAFGN
jgi:hypothetical protein